MGFFTKKERVPFWTPSLYLFKDPYAKLNALCFLLRRGFLGSFYYLFEIE